MQRVAAHFFELARPATYTLAGKPAQERIMRRLTVFVLACLLMAGAGLSALGLLHRRRH